jgi:ArsR family metal-binding transcriptional regulator
MLLQSYDLDVRTMACDCHQESLAVYAALHQDIGPALPYLNAIYPAVVYDAGPQVLTWQRDGHAVAIRPREIAISDVADREDAVRQVDAVMADVNDAWDRRDQILPSNKKRVRTPALTIFRALPGTNCKQCGEQTCWNFAAKLSCGIAELDACTPLLQDTYAGRRVALRDLLANAH